MFVVWRVSVSVCWTLPPVALCAGKVLCPMPGGVEGLCACLLDTPSCPLHAGKVWSRMPFGIEAVDGHGCALEACCTARVDAGH
jgi:hypothetical protein